METIFFFIYAFVIIPICISFIIAIVCHFIALYVSLKNYGFKKTVIHIFNAIKKDLGIY